jgi:hypothetical protein
MPCPGWNACPHLRQRFSLIRQPAQEEEYAAEIGIFSTSAEYWFASNDASAEISAERWNYRLKGSPAEHGVFERIGVLFVHEFERKAFFEVTHHAGRDLAEQDL